MRLQSLLGRAGLPDLAAVQREGRRGHRRIPATVLRVLGPEPWNVAYVEPSYRPDDGRYAENPNRMQMHTQFQVILKPAPENSQELYLKQPGSDRHRPPPARHPLRRGQLGVARAGAWGLGWEVWLDGLEITQYTYFQQAGGYPARPGADRVHLRPRAHRHVPAGREGGLADRLGRQAHVRRRAQAAGDRALQVRLRDRGRGPAQADVRPVRGRGARAAWRTGWSSPRTTTSCAARTPSTCSTRAAPSASPSARTSSPACATWRGRCPEPTSSSGSTRSIRGWKISDRRCRPSGFAGRSATRRTWQPSSLAAGPVSAGNRHRGIAPGRPGRRDRAAADCVPKLLDELRLAHGAV